MAEIRIGTSGWAYKHWKSHFYPTGLAQVKWLSYYADEFDTVEINSTFYRLARRSTFHKWSGQVPDNFLFAVKGSRYITHIKRLRIERESIDMLIDATSGLSNKLGPFLFQLPPNLKYDRKVLQSFIELLPCGYRYVLEPRHESWFVDDAIYLLRERNICLCFVSSPGLPSKEMKTSDFIFLRMHGSKLLYGSNYSDTELRSWARKIRRWAEDGQDCYIYFNNDAMAFAIKNARRLKELLEAGVTKRQIAA